VYVCMYVCMYVRMHVCVCVCVLMMHHGYYKQASTHQYRTADFLLWQKKRLEERVKN
jgi:hypothetical protein